MIKKMSIVVKTQFEGLHLWSHAPSEVGFLRTPHRHIFYVEVEMEVSHDDRDLEFILVKRSIDSFLNNTDFEITVSCEQIADMICKHVWLVYGKRAIKCCVYEDNENGGCVKYEG